MNRFILFSLLITLLWLAPAAHAGSRLHAFLVPDRTAAILLIGALFYCGFKWRAR